MCNYKYLCHKYPFTSLIKIYNANRSLKIFNIIELNITCDTVYYMCKYYSIFSYKCVQKRAMWLSRTVNYNLEIMLVVVQAVLHFPSTSSSTFTNNLSPVFILSLFLFAFFLHPGHRGHTPWSHFPEGRTWVPFPLHNHGKLRHLRNPPLMTPDDALQCDVWTLLVGVTVGYWQAVCWMTFGLHWLVCVCSQWEGKKKFFAAFTDCMLFPVDLQIFSLLLVKKSFITKI